MTDIGRNIWFELWVRDVEVAKAFYVELFDWGYEPMTAYDPGYWLIRTDGESIGAIVASPPDAALPSDQGTIVYVGVSDLGETVERAVALGAAVVMRPTSIPDGSAFAIIRDPLGNRLGLWSRRPSHSGVGR